MYFFVFPSICKTIFFRETIQNPEPEVIIKEGMFSEKVGIFLILFISLTDIESNFSNHM